MSVSSVIAVGKRFVTDVIEDEVPERSAALAYRFLFAIFPFAIFLAATAAFVAGWLGLGDPTDDIIGALGDNLPPDVAATISPQLRAVLGEARPGLVSVGALGALWAATGGISALIGAMNRAYDVEETRSFFTKTAVAVALTVLGSVGILVAFVTVVGGSLLTEQVVARIGLGADAWGVITLARWPVVLAMVAVAVALLFHLGPNIRVHFRWTLLGGVLFAIGWLIATAGFAVYVANFASYADTYGALGGVVVLMLWFYITALMLLLAAEVTAFLAKAREPETLEARRRELASPPDTVPHEAPSIPGPVVPRRPRAGRPARQPAPAVDVRPPVPAFAAMIVAAGVAAGAALGLLAGRAVDEA